MVRKGVLFLLFACLVELAPVARAQTTLADTEARARFEAGRAALAAGRLEDALADFRRAYELSHRPELLYNVGVAADRLRRDAEALEAFERYLAEMPPEELPNREEVEARIVVLRRMVSPEPSPEPEPVAPAGHGPSGPGIALAVSGGVVLIAGAVLLGLGVADRASVEGAPRDARWVDYAGAAERAPILEGIGGAALGVGAAVTALGVVLLVTDGSSDERVALAPFGLGGQVVGTW